MSVYIDQKYVSMVGVKLEGFVRKSSGVYNFRCCLCGDSRKSKSKKRGYIYEKKGKFFFRCMNCGHSTTFRNFLKIVDPYLYQEYQVDCYKNNNIDRVLEPDWHEFISKPTFPALAKINLPTLASLPDDHTAKKYAVGRKIPKPWLDRLYYANDFKAFVSEVFPGRSTALKGEDARLVIPFFDCENELIGIQGRSLSGASSYKYITVKRTDDCPKIFGLDRLNSTQKIYVVEGIFDAFFLPNCVAVMQGDLWKATEFVSKDNCIFVPDRDVRNREVMKSTEKLIDKGVAICLLPPDFPGKDLNEAVVAGIGVDELKQIVDNNTFDGLKARLHFHHWRKA